MNILDKAISVFAPKWGVDRAHNRAVIDAYEDQKKIQASFNGIGGGTGGTLGGYKGAAGGRLSDGWITSTQPAVRQNLTAPVLRALRDRARDLERNNVIADGMLTRCVDNVIADGFALQVTASNPAWTQEQNAAWCEKAESLMEGWFDNADDFGLGFVEHCQVVFRAHLRDGDVGTVLLATGQLKVIEGDQIADPQIATNQALDVSADTVNGVKLDPTTNRPVGYYVNVTQPDGKQSSQLIDARDMVFLPRLKRMSVRGEPCFAQSFDLFNQIDRWIEAQLAAARAAACLSIFVKKTNPQQMVQNLPTVPSGVGDKATPEMTLRPGMISVLGENEDIQTVNPTQPAQSFPDNMAMMLRFLGLSLGLPLELTLLDFSRTSYNSARASLQQAYRRFQAMQDYFVSRYLARIYRWRISKFIKDGLLEANPDAFSHRWIAKPWSALDPLKEAQANMLNIDMGMESLSGMQQANGIDFDDWVIRRANELKAQQLNGIPVVHHVLTAPYNATNPLTPMDVALINTLIDPDSVGSEDKSGNGGDKNAG